MDFGIMHDNGTVTISPNGNVDYVTAPELDAVIEREAPDAVKLVLDMRHVAYISSAGLRSILNADELMEEKEGIVLTNVNKEVMSILAMTGFTDILEID